MTWARPSSSSSSQDKVIKPFVLPVFRGISVVDVERADISVALPLFWTCEYNVWHWHHLYLGRYPQTATSSKILLCHGLDWVIRYWSLNIILHSHDVTQCLGFWWSVQPCCCFAYYSTFNRFSQDKSLSHVLSCSSGSSSTACLSSGWLSSQTVKNGRFVLSPKLNYFNRFCLWWQINKYSICLSSSQHQHILPAETVKVTPQFCGELSNQPQKFRLPSLKVTLHFCWILHPTLIPSILQENDNELKLLCLLTVCSLHVPGHGVWSQLPHSVHGKLPHHCCCGPPEAKDQETKIKDSVILNDDRNKMLWSSPNESSCHPYCCH